MFDDGLETAENVVVGARTGTANGLKNENPLLDDGLETDENDEVGARTGTANGFTKPKLFGIDGCGLKLVEDPVLMGVAGFDELRIGDSDPQNGKQALNFIFWPH